MECGVEGSSATQWLCILEVNREAGERFIRCMEILKMYAQARSAEDQQQAVMEGPATAEDESSKCKAADEAADLLKEQKIARFNGVYVRKGTTEEIGEIKNGKLFWAKRFGRLISDETTHANATQLTFNDDCLKVTLILSGKEHMLVVRDT